MPSPKHVKYPLFSKSLLLGLPLLLGGFVSFFILDHYSRSKEMPKLDEFALGEETSSNFGFVDGHPVHYSGLTKMGECLNGFKQTNLKDIVLWLGNSQIHAINQMQVGDETAAPILHRRLREFGYYFLTFSQPNASLQEHYLLFEYLLNQLPVRVLVLPIVFDDMRESGIRPGLKDALADEQVAERLAQTSVGRKLLANFGERDSAGNDMAALEDTFQERTERFLNDRLAKHSSIWSQRGAMRGQVYTSLYKLRNWMFGISPLSVRKIIPGRYLSNKGAFEAILGTARGRGVKVLVYVVPLRNDVPVPYDSDEYAAFKREMQSICERFGTSYVNLENLVPGDLWGTKASISIEGGKELDFMHFKAGGHKLLAKRLDAELSVLLEKEGRQ